MAKMKEAKKVGLYKLEELSEKVVVLGNGIRMTIIPVASQPERINFVKVSGIGGELEGKLLGASQLVQIGMALADLDRTKKFICGFHGTFESPVGSAQKPSCGKCHSSAVAASVSMMESSGVFEEDDA